MNRPTLLLLLLPIAAAGCDYSGDFLFNGAVPGVPDIWVLGPEGGDQGAPLVPATIDNPDDIRANTIYAEVGAPATTAYGGVTFEFAGTGRAVCLWVDPELAYWSEAISPRPTQIGKKWAYPDNIFDDGDLDLLAGLSVYYTGSPGESIGDFKVSYEDALGNTVPISLASCPNTLGAFEDPASAGRGAPEFCDIPTTDVGIDYTVVLRTWSTPLDDDRLSFGVILADRPCITDDADPPNLGLREIGGGGQSQTDECVIEGESLTPEPVPEGKTAPVFYGYDAVHDAGRIWPGSEDFENQYCGDGSMKKFCEKEAADHLGNAPCEREVIDDPKNRCFCGDPDDSPSNGAF